MTSFNNEMQFAMALGRVERELRAARAAQAQYDAKKPKPDATTVRLATRIADLTSEKHALIDEEMRQGQVDL